MSLPRERWTALMARNGLPPSEDMFARLDAAHAEPQRHYHTAEHITACLRHLDELREHAKDPDAIELAIWFHDAVYKPTSKTNEADSALMARAFLEPHLPAKRVDFVDGTIRLTQSHGATFDTDINLMLDIDLSILAAAPHIYDRYAQDIRKEYRWVPGPLYRKGRRKVLRHFLDMPTIYKREDMRELWGAVARENLERELEALG